MFIFKNTNSYYIVLSQYSVLSIYYPSLSHNSIQFQELTPGLRSRTRSRATATRASSPKRTLSLECDSSTDLCSDRSDSHWIFENNHQFITQTRHCMCVCSCVCLCVRHAALIYVHIEQAMYINFNSATHKKIERLEPSPAQPRSSSEQQLLLRRRRRLRLRQRLRLCDSLDY